MNATCAVNSNFSFNFNRPASSTPSQMGGEVGFVAGRALNELCLRLYSWWIFPPAQTPTERIQKLVRGELLSKFERGLIRGNVAERIDRLLTTLPPFLKEQPHDFIKDVITVITRSSIPFEEAFAKQPLLPYCRNDLPSVSFRQPHLPEAFARFLYPEIELAIEGMTGCVFKGKELIGEKRCEHLSVITINSLKQQGMLNVIEDPVAFQERGFAIELPEYANARILLGMDSLKMTNYRAAIQWINHSFSLDNPKNILEMLLKIHEILVKDIPDVLGNFHGGHYRKKNLYIRPGNFNGSSEEDFIRQLKLMGGSKIDERHLRGLFKKVKKEGNLNIVLPSLTSGERNALEKVVTIPPSPEHISSLMQQFTEQLYHLRDEHPVSVAAWAHCRFVAIHPFMDGNGRLARLLLNALLTRGGFDPLIFPDDATYDSAIFDDAKHHPGAFTDYLFNDVIPWNRNQF